MAKGISVFIGMNYTLEQNIEYIKKAYELGFTSIFTSLHIPEADYKKATYEFKEMLKVTNELGMNVIADISPRAFEYLGIDRNDIKKIKELGVYGIRLDFGFTPEEMSSFTTNPYGLVIEINASTVTRRFLEEFDSFKPNYSNIQACHNYYPRLNTGISETTYVKKNEMLKKYNIKIGAFIPSLVNKRGPVFEGLPTLEMHRNIEPQISAKHLFALGVDSVIFGDSIATLEELESVGKLREDVIEFRIETFTECEVQRKIMFESIHKDRTDSAEDVIRSTSSRESLGREDVINTFNNIERKVGFITIDNRNYLRYAGELQICKSELPADGRVNVVGKIVDEEIFLMNFIDEEKKFMFVSNK